MAPATDVRFYHCTRSPALDVALILSAKAYAAGERLLILADPEALEALDQRLWAEPADSFLPHGLARDLAWADRQPILLADRPEPVNGARLLMLVDQPLPEGLERFARIFHLFEDGSDAHLRAREEWKGLGARTDVRRSYWQQTPAGKWQEKG
ncbi:DNA polymerase III subunit chi [Thermaurantiacus sp.]